MADLEFEVAPRRTTPVTFSLGLEPGQSAGDEPHVYTFIPPKSALMLMPVLAPELAGDSQGLAMTKATFDWLGEGLSKEDNERIQRRLKDPKDGLDIDLLSEVIQKLTEKNTGRPTS